MPRAEECVCETSVRRRDSDAGSRPGELRIAMGRSDKTRRVRRIKLFRKY